MIDALYATGEREEGYEYRKKAFRSQNVFALYDWCIEQEKVFFTIKEAIEEKKKRFKVKDVLEL